MCRVIPVSFSTRHPLRPYNPTYLIPTSLEMDLIPKILTLSSKHDWRYHSLSLSSLKEPKSEMTGEDSGDGQEATFFLIIRFGPQLHTWLTPFVKHHHVLEDVPPEISMKFMPAHQVKQQLRVQPRHAGLQLQRPEQIPEIEIRKAPIQPAVIR